MQWIKHNWFVLLFVAINLAVAAPAQAGVKNAMCEDPQGQSSPCCQPCFWFCGCDYDE